MALCRASLLILFVGVLSLNLMALTPDSDCQTKVWTPDSGCQTKVWTPAAAKPITNYQLPIANYPFIAFSKFG